MRNQGKLSALVFLLCSLVAGSGNAAGKGSISYPPPPILSTTGRLWMSGAETGIPYSGTGEFGHTNPNALADNLTMHSGNYSILMNGNTSVTSWFFNVPELYARYYIYLASNPTTESLSFFCIDGTGTGTILVSVNLQADRTLSVKNWVGVPGVVGTSSTALATNTWYMVEVHYKSSATAGLVELKIDGNLEVSSSCNDPLARNVKACSFGPLDTYPGARTYYDDFAINGSSGPDQNTWCGPGSIVMIHPDTDSSPLGWTAINTDGLVNFTHYSEIDDLNGGGLNNGNYIRTTSGVNGLEDCWEFTNLPAIVSPSASINCIQVGVHGGGTGAQSRTAMFRGRDSSGNALNGKNIEWNFPWFYTYYPMFTAYKTWDGISDPLSKSYVDGFRGAAVDTNSNTREIRWGTVFANVEYVNP